MSRLARGAGKVLFWAWAPLAIVIGASLMLGHWYTLPRPSAEEASLASAVGALRRPNERDGWLATHVLYSECRCSQRILTHLFQRRSLAGVVEKILLVGSANDYVRQGKAAGFDVIVVGETELADRFHIQAVPLLVVQNPANGVRYLGGYTDKKQGPDIGDVSIIRDLVAGQSRPELPLFGCAVSEKLQALSDPFGLKYSRKTGSAVR
jgi:hypothetical protein